MAGMSGAKPSAQRQFDRIAKEKPDVYRRVETGLDSRDQKRAQKPENTIIGVSGAQPTAQAPVTSGNPTIGSSGRKLGA